MYDPSDISLTRLQNGRIISYQLAPTCVPNIVSLLRRDILNRRRTYLQVWFSRHALTRNVSVFELVACCASYTILYYIRRYYGRDCLGTATTTTIIYRGKSNKKCKKENRFFFLLFYSFLFFVHNNVHELNIVLLVFSDFANILYEYRMVDEVEVRIRTLKNG